MSGGLKRNLIPLLDRVLVQRLKAQAQTSSGIILPDSAVSKMNEGTIIAVGPGRLAEDGKRVPMELKVGQTVLLPEYGGTPVNLDKSNEDEGHILFRHDDILAVLEN